MSRTLRCSTHGEAQAAFICQHLLATLRDGTPRGAIWKRDEDGCINSYCGDCDKRLDAAGDEWVGEAQAQLGLTVVCENCFRRIAEINGLPELG